MTQWKLHALKAAHICEGGKLNSTETLVSKKGRKTSDLLSRTQMKHMYPLSSFLHVLLAGYSPARKNSNACG